MERADSLHWDVPSPLPEDQDSTEGKWLGEMYLVFSLYNNVLYYKVAFVTSPITEY